MKHEIKDPADPGFRVQYELYAADDSGSPPWVVLLPPTGGANFLDRRYARKLRDQGASVMLVTDWTGLTEEPKDLGIHNRGLALSLRAFDLLRARAGGARLRLFGTSLGGLFAATMAYHRPDGVERLVLVVTGGPLSRVVATSKLSNLVQLKKDRRAQLGFADDEAYRKILADKIPLDFIADKPYEVAPEKVLMVIAKSDESVPTVTQETLWEKLGKPRRLDVDGGHFFTIIGSYLWRASELTEFVSRND